MKPDNESILFSLPLAFQAHQTTAKVTNKEERKWILGPLQSVFRPRLQETVLDTLWFKSWKYSGSTQLVYIKYMLLWIKS